MGSHRFLCSFPYLSFGLDIDRCGDTTYCYLWVIHPISRSFDDFRWVQKASSMKGMGCIAWGWLSCKTHRMLLEISRVVFSKYKERDCGPNPSPKLAKLLPAPRFLSLYFILLILLLDLCLSGLLYITTLFGLVLIFALVIFIKSLPVGAFIISSP